MTALKSPTMTSPRSFLLDVDPETSVARITLNRPERLNALTFEVYDELGTTFRALDTEPEVRAIVDHGGGGAGSARAGMSRTSSARSSNATSRGCWSSHA